MQSRSKQGFSCFWQPSLRLSLAVLLISSLACCAVMLAAMPWLLKLCALLVLAIQIGWQFFLIYNRKQAYIRRGLRHNQQSWQLWSAKHGWRSIQLRADSIAIPALVLVRYRFAHQRFYRSAVISADSLSQDSHRRLRVRLKFSRQRWQAIK